MSVNLFEVARQRAGLTQEELAQRGGTSRPTLSAYESGRKSPTLATAERILEVAGFSIAIERTVTFQKIAVPRGRPFYVADNLWRLSPSDAFAEVHLPLALNWSEPTHRFRLRDRGDRARCYEIVLREGTPSDIVRYVDGVLLVEMWNELVLPRTIRAAWAPIVESVTD